MRHNFVVVAEEFPARSDLDRELVVEHENAVAVARALEGVEAEMARHRGDSSAAPRAVDADIIVGR